MYDKDEQRKVAMGTRCFFARSNCLDMEKQMPYNKVTKVASSVSRCDSHALLFPIAVVRLL